MKKGIVIISTALLISLLSGCNDWLDVSPRSETESEKLYSTEDGYLSSMAGAYLQIRDRNLYGYRTTMYLPEFLARNWSYPEDNMSQRYLLSHFDYTNSSEESLLENLWIRYYAVIVQLNDLLDQIEKTSVHFSGNNKEILTGEALGLRAMLHFDILRYFGPVPVNADMNENAIPYMQVVSTKNNILEAISIPYKEVIKKIEEDLNAAEKIMEEVDPITIYSNQQLSQNITTSSDLWANRRQSRFNYYAILATKARFYLWIGDKQQAAQYAQLVVDALDGAQTTESRFPLISEDYYASVLVNSIVSPEHIFNISAPDMEDAAENDYNKSTNSTFLLRELTGTPSSLLTTLYGPENPADIRYVGSGASRDDERYWTRTTNSNYQYYLYKKYLKGKATTHPCVIPIIRISEMYLILAESLPEQEAIEMFRTFKSKRSMASPTTSVPITDIEKEYRKEFLGEGQMFFFYKRLNYSSFNWPERYTLPAGNPYVLPKPKKQTGFE